MRLRNCLESLRMRLTITAVAWWTLGQMLTVAGMSCEVKKGVSMAHHDVRDAAMSGLTMQAGRNANNMQVFQCTCNLPNEEFGDSNAAALDSQFFRTREVDWSTSQIFRIYNCNTLSLSMNTGPSTLSDFTKSSLLILENIAVLNLKQFTVGRPSNVIRQDTFSSFYFRNVTFYLIPSALVFEDRYEVLMSQVSAAPGVAAVEPFAIRVSNTNYSMNPVFSLEDSSFGGIDLVKDGMTRTIFSLNIQNMQKKDNDKCYYDYRGQINLRRNSFGYLKKRGVLVTNGMEMNIEHNQVETIGEGAFEIINMKSIAVSGNKFSYMLTDPIMNIFFDRGGSLNCLTQNMPESAVSAIRLNNNDFPRLTSTMIQLIPDLAYSNAFITQKVKEFKGTTVSKGCNCTDPDFGPKPTASQKLFELLLSESQCLSNQKPMPLMGLRRDICQGRMPLNPSDLEAMIRYQIQYNWLIYLIVAVVLTFILTAIVTCVLSQICSCCFCSSSKTEKSPTVSPHHY